MKFIEQTPICTQTNNFSNIQTPKKTPKLDQKSESKKSSQTQPKISRWTPEQNVLYLRFLKQNLEKFTDKCPKKFLKFERMSFEIESKTPDQCRSHHQKMMMRYKSIENIISGQILGAKKEADVQTERSFETTAQEKLIDQNQQLLIQGNTSCEIQMPKEKSPINQCNVFSDEHLFDVLFDLTLF